MYVQCILYMYVYYVFCHVVLQYFETDDPELYTTKVKYVKESDVSDLELMFAEEVFSPSTGSVTEVSSTAPNMYHFGM